MARRDESRRGWEAIRARILKRDAYTCGWCGLDMRAAGLPSSEMHVDHVVPIDEARRRGWTEAEIRDPGNLVSACAPCNLSRNKRPGPPARPGQRSTPAPRPRAYATPRPGAPEPTTHAAPAGWATTDNGRTTWNLGARTEATR